MRRMRKRTAAGEPAIKHTPGTALQFRGLLTLLAQYLTIKYGQYPLYVAVLGARRADWADGIPARVLLKHGRSFWWSRS